MDTTESTVTSVPRASDEVAPTPEAAQAAASAAAEALIPPPARAKRGFAVLSPEKKREIASMGGKAAHEHGRAHRFTPGGRGVGFAVLGGAFGEGIDLPGDRLVGAFVATLGLPQVNAVNELLRTRMEAAFGAGFDYAYLYPGLRKVVQAAGRVIRTREDRGVVWLIDDRFCRPEVRALLPAWWRPQVAG